MNMDSIDDMPSDQPSFNNTANLGSETVKEFENLKLKIKEAQLSDSLDYSLLEDQVMPEYYESSPDIEIKHKKLFSQGVSPLVLNDTVPNSPGWQEKISDESFLRTEELVQNMDPNISIDSVIQELENSKNSKEPKLQDSLDNYSNTTKTEFNDTLDNCLNDTKREFNDTLEEMEYFMNQAQKNMQKSEVSNTEEKLEKVVPPVMKPAHPVNKLFKDVQYSSPMRASPRNMTPLKDSNLNSATKSKVGYSYGSPMRKATPSKTVTPQVTPFKPPLKLQFGSSNKKAGELKHIKINHHMDKFENVVSPIQFYIKHSPTVPIYKNVSPSKNYWDRVPPKNVNQNPKIMKNLGKENAHLPETAYKAPEIRNVIANPTTVRLPKNHNKVIPLVDNLPKPIVIKHIKREKFESEYKNRSSENLVDDSFAHLPNKNSDVSICVGKVPQRTRTLK